MEDMLEMPPELREEAHLMELESMGYTIVHEAIPPQLLKKIKLAHNQAIERIRSSKPEADWSWESDNPGVCDYWRLYQLDPVFEELLTLPSIFNIIKRAFKEGRGRPATDEGIRLMHEMGQHLPAKTPGGQAWHRDGMNKKAENKYPNLRCTFTLNDLPSNGGGTIVLPGSHRPGFDGNYFHVLNNTKEKVKYEKPRPGRSSPPYDRSSVQPRKMPNAVTFSGKAGSCMINWVSIWHTRPTNESNVDRDVIWQIFRTARSSLGNGRRQHHQTKNYLSHIRNKNNNYSPEFIKLFDDSETIDGTRWDFEGLSKEEIERTTAAEPLFPSGRPAIMEQEDDETNNYNRRENNAKL